MNLPAYLWRAGVVSATKRQALVRQGGFALAILLSSVGACTRSTEGDEVTLSSGFVYGRVFSASGAPLRGATVAAVAHFDTTSCRAASASADIGENSESDSLGRYRSRVSTPLGPSVRCISVRARAPGAPGALSYRRGAVGLLRLSLNTDRGARDSLAVDVHLP